MCLVYHYPFTFNEITTSSFKILKCFHRQRLIIQSNVCQIDDDEEPNMLVVNFISKIVKSPRVTGHLLTIYFLGVQLN